MASIRSRFKDGDTKVTYSDEWAELPIIAKLDSLSDTMEVLKAQYNFLLEEWVEEKDGLRQH